jgi:hypothetical protein
VADGVAELEFGDGGLNTEATAAWERRCGEARRGEEGVDAGGARFRWSTQRNRRVSPRPAHEKAACSRAPPLGNAPWNSSAEDAAVTDRPDGLVGEVASPSATQPALRRNCPSTGIGVIRRGGHGPR